MGTTASRQMSRPSGRASRTRSPDGLIPHTIGAIALELIEHNLEHVVSGIGGNRCLRQQNPLGVNNDLLAVRKWVESRATSPRTKGAFLGEIRRLYWWLWNHARRPLSDLTTEDFEAYREFLRNPGSDAIGPKVPFLLDNGYVNRDWRPFTAPLTAAHIGHVLTILNGLLSYLVRHKYLDANPLAAMRLLEKRSMGDARVRSLSPTERALDRIQWQAVLEAADGLPSGTAAQQAMRARSRFLVRLAYYLGARIGELATHTMGDVRQVKGRWVWHVVGKGGKESYVAVNSALLAALSEYRVFLGLAELPKAGDSTPLLLNTRGTMKAITPRQAYRLIKSIFGLAADRLQRTDPERAAVLRQASPHWLRHATASHLASQAKTVDELVAVQRHMRHSDIKTTLAYTHLNDTLVQDVAERLANRTD